MVLSITMRSATAHGDSIDDYAIFSITIRSMVIALRNVSAFVSELRSAAAHGDTMDQYAVFSITMRSMVIAWTNIWSSITMRSMVIAEGLGANVGL